MKPNANTVILVVEDDNNTRRIIRQILFGIDFRKVEEAKDGSTALDQLMRCNPALIILDWQLPQLSGIALLRTIRSEPPFQEIPVIMVTGRADKEAVEEAIQAGITDYVVKPFSVKTLESKIKKILGG